MTTGAKIRYYRSLRGLGITELAMRLEVEPSLISMWESDQMEPSAEEVNRLCGVLGVSPAMLYADGGTAPNSPFGDPAATMGGQSPYGYVPPSYMPNSPPMPAKARVWKAVALVLFICSIMSIFLYVIISDTVATLGGGTVAMLVSCGVVALIPIASIVVGIVMCAKGIPNMKNIVAGAITLCLLLLFGGVTATTAMEGATEVPADLQAIESAIGIDLPEHDGADAYEYGTTTELDLYFSGAEADALHDMIMADSRFMSECPTVLVGMLPEATYLYYDAYLIYCVETNSFNTLPTERGAFSCISICYDAEGDMLEIYRYTLNFIPA